MNGRNRVPTIAMRGIVKRFGGVTAPDEVDMAALAGEVLAIVGDNGAGKSTLIKCLTGVYQPSAGRIEMDGRALSMSGHSDAAALGIDAVYQTLALADHMTPGANAFLGNELMTSVLGVPLLDYRRMRNEAEAVLLDRLGVRLPGMESPAASLSGGRRQAIAIAIARAVYPSDLRVLVMDEPKAARGPQETARTLRLIETLRAQGLAIILISHSLDNVFEVADRVQVMRRGRRAGVVRTTHVTTQDVSGMIVGAEEAEPGRPHDRAARDRRDRHRDAARHPGRPRPVRALHGVHRPGGDDRGDPPRDGRAQAPHAISACRT